jgi:exonuclease SbcD
MRLLHTADWHLGDRLHRIDRTDDIRQAVEQIARYCQQEHVDVLLIAGDLFSEQIRPDSWRKHIEHLKETFHPFLQGGGTIVAITGNHDSEHLCDTLAQVMELVDPLPADMPADAPARRGRLYLATEPTLLRLADPSGVVVQFVLMPYPRASHYPQAHSQLGTCHSPEERQRLLAAHWQRRLEQLRHHPHFDQHNPAVLVAHIQLAGANLEAGLFRLSPLDDVVVPRASWIDTFDYVALGHIHQPQLLHHSPPVRYSGSIECLDIGEKKDRKSVVVFDLGPDGLATAPRLLPLDATPIEEIVILNPETDLPRLQQLYSETWRQRALVKLDIRYTAAQHLLEDLLYQTARLFPRWYARHWQEANEQPPLICESLTEQDPSQSVAQTVRDYLKQVLADHPDEERDALMQMAEQLLQQAAPHAPTTEATILFDPAAADQ